MTEFISRKSLLDSIDPSSQNIQAAIDQISILSPSLIKHLNYYTKSSTTLTQTTFTPPIDTKTNSPYTINTIESNLINQLSKDLLIDSECSFMLLRSFIKQTKTIESIDDFNIDLHYHQLLTFYALERVNTLYLWESIFRNASSSDRHAPLFEKFIRNVFDDGVKVDEFALSFLPLPTSPDERKSALKILFYMFYTVFPAPDLKVVEKLMGDMLVRPDDMQVLVVLCILPKKVFPKCHPAVDLQSACLQSSTKDNVNFDMSGSIRWFVEARYDSDLQTYAKSIFRLLFNQTCEAFQETDLMFEWFLKIYDNEKLLIEDFWRQDFQDQEKKEVLDVWKRRFPVNNEIIRGMLSVLCETTAMEVYNYFDSLDTVTDYASDRYQIEMNSKEYNWIAGGFVKGANRVQVYPGRGALAQRVTKGDFEVLSVNVRCSGWTLCLSLLDAFSNAPELRYQKESIVTLETCILILRLFAQLLLHFQPQQAALLKQLPKEFPQILMDVTRVAFELGETELLAESISCLGEMRIVYPFTSQIRVLFESEQRTGTYTFLKSFLKYALIIECTGFIAYFKHLFTSHENWKYNDINDRFVIGELILRVCREAGDPHTPNVSSYFSMLENYFGDTDNILKFIKEALTNGTGGVFCGYPNLDIARLGLKSATLDDIDSVWGLKSIFPADVSKCLKGFCDKGWAIEKCLEFALDYAGVSLNLIESLASHGFIRQFDKDQVWKILNQPVSTPQTIQDTESMIHKVVLLTTFVYAGLGLDSISQYMTLGLSLNLPNSDIDQLSKKLLKHGHKLSQFKLLESGDYGDCYLYNTGQISNVSKLLPLNEFIAMAQLVQNVNSQLSLIDATIILYQKWSELLELRLTQGEKIDCFTFIVNIFEKIEQCTRNDKVTLLWMTELTFTLQFLLKFWVPVSFEQVCKVLGHLESLMKHEALLEIDNVLFKQNVSVCLHLTLLSYTNCNYAYDTVIQRVFSLLSNFWTLTTKQHIAANLFDETKTLHSFIVHSFTLIMRCFYSNQIDATHWIGPCEDILCALLSLLSHLFQTRKEYALILDMHHLIQVFSENQSLAGLIVSQGTLTLFMQHSTLVKSSKLYLLEIESPLGMIFTEQLEILNTLIETLPEYNQFLDSVLGIVGGVYWDLIQERMNVKGEPLITLSELKHIESITRLFYHLGKTLTLVNNKQQNWSVSIGYQSLSIQVLKYVCFLMRHPKSLATKVQAYSIKEKQMQQGNLWGYSVCKTMSSILVNSVHYLRWSSGSESVMTGLDTQYISIFTEDKNGLYLTGDLMDTYGLLTKELEKGGPNRGYINTGIESVLVILFQEYMHCSSDDDSIGLKKDLDVILNSGACDSEYCEFVKKQI